MQIFMRSATMMRFPSITLLVLFFLCGLAYCAPKGECRNPPVRKEWRTLKKHEQSAYISAVLCLQRLPSKHQSQFPGSASRFEDFLGTHIVSTDTIHFVGHFQPWHRYFLAAYEDALRSECGYRGAQPYWDWTLDTVSTISIFKSPVFKPSAFGGNGPYLANPDVPRVVVPGRTGGGCVLDGPFRDLVLNLGPGLSVVKRPHCLTRDISPYVTNQALTPERVSRTLAARDFAEFDIRVQGTIEVDDNVAYHAGAHLGIGAEMGTISDIYSSPGDPLFYLHHANMDRLWWEWQKRDLEKRVKDITGPDTQFAGPFAFFGAVPYKNITLEFELDMRGLVKNASIEEVMRVGSGKSCYLYK